MAVVLNWLISVLENQLFTLCTGWFTTLCEKAMFFIKEVLILNKDKKLFPVECNEIMRNLYFHFAKQITSGKKTKEEKYMPRAPPSGPHIKYKGKN